MADVQEQMIDAMLDLLGDLQVVMRNLSDGFGNTLAQLETCMGVEPDDPAFDAARQYLLDAKRIDGKLTSTLRMLRT